jgi:hypothetical protein
MEGSITLDASSPEGSTFVVRVPVRVLGGTPIESAEAVKA